MKKQVLFVQGGGEGAHQIDAELVTSLGRELGPSYQIHYPAMPNEGSPEYAAWKRCVAEEIPRAGDGVMLVGHSVGATVLINFLAEGSLRQRIGGVFLIAAPFVGKGGWQTEDFEAPENIGARLPDDVPIYLYQGSNDETVPLSHIELYARDLPQAVIRRLEARNHQLNDDLSEVARDIEQLG